MSTPKNVKVSTLAKLSTFLIVLVASSPQTEAAQSQEESKSAQSKTDELGPLGRQEFEQRLQELEERLLAAEVVADSSSQGTNQFLWSGYGFTRFVDAEGQDSSFSSVYAPLVLYKIGENILFESEFEFELEFDGEGETQVSIEYMNASYIVNDHLVVGIGLFLTPFGIFAERIHPPWINKLADGPLIAGHDGIVPFSSLGVFARGGLQAGPTKWNYSLFLSNGPRLNTGEDEPDEAGLLHFDNYDDVNNNKSIGGRLAMLPIPELEIGASFLSGEVSPSDSDVGDTDALLYGLDLSFNHGPRAIGGQLEFRSEWVWSEVDDAIYDADGTIGFGPLAYENDRSGGWLQASYRPTWQEHSFLSKCEGVVRWDKLQRPGGAPEIFDEKRWTLGLNYWMNASTVVKVAYRFDERDAGEQDVNALLLQIAVGF